MRLLPPATGSPRLPGPAIPPDARHNTSSSCWRRLARSTFSGVSSSDWISISPSRQSSNSSCKREVSERIVGASVMRLVALRWNVYAAMNRGISTRYTPTSFSIVCSGASGSRTASMKVTNASFAGCVSRSGFISRSSGSRLCHSSLCQAW